MTFRRDCVGAGDSLQLDMLLKKEGDSSILFADRIDKINRNGLVQERILLVSDRALYTLSRDAKAKYKGATACRSRRSRASRCRVSPTAT